MPDAITVNALTITLEYQWYRIGSGTSLNAVEARGTRECISSEIDGDFATVKIMNLPGIINGAIRREVRSSTRSKTLKIKKTIIHEFNSQSAITSRLDFTINILLDGRVTQEQTKVSIPNIFSLYLDKDEKVSIKLLGRQQWIRPDIIDSRGHARGTKDSIVKTRKSKGTKKGDGEVFIILMPIERFKHKVEQKEMGTSIESSSKEISELIMSIYDTENTNIKHMLELDEEHMTRLGEKADPGDAIYGTEEARDKLLAIVETQSRKLMRDATESTRKHALNNKVRANELATKIVKILEDNKDLKEVVLDIDSQVLCRTKCSRFITNRIIDVTLQGKLDKNAIENLRSILEGDNNRPCIQACSRRLQSLRLAQFRKRYTLHTKRDPITELVKEYFEGTSASRTITVQNSGITPHG